MLLILNTLVTQREFKCIISNILRVVFSMFIIKMNSNVKEKYLITEILLVFLDKLDKLLFFENCNL